MYIQASRLLGEVACASNEMPSVSYALCWTQNCGAMLQNDHDPLFSSKLRWILRQNFGIELYAFYRGDLPIVISFYVGTLLHLLKQLCCY